MVVASAGLLVLVSTTIGAAAAAAAVRLVPTVSASVDDAAASDADSSSGRTSASISTLGISSVGGPPSQTGSMSSSSSAAGGSAPASDVDDDHADVVAATTVVGHLDEPFGGPLRIVVRGQDVGDVLVGDLVDEAVAAQEEAVAADEGQRPGVDLDRRIDAEGAGDDVAARVVAGLVGGDVTGVDQLLHVAVVDRDPAQPLVAEQVGARVADVGEGQGLPVVGVGDDRRAA